MKRLRFLMSVPTPSSVYDPGEVADVSDEAAELFIRTHKAVEVRPPVCPHCGGDLEEEAAAPEAAALSGAGERATLPGARKRG